VTSLAGCCCRDSWGLVNRRKLSVSLIGSDRVDWDDDRWRDRVQRAFASEVDASPEVDAVARTTRYVRADVTDPKDLDHLLRSCSAPVILYFALPPAVTEHACRALTGLSVAPDTRLVMEKPFGSDAASADKLNQVLTRLVPEDQIFRVSLSRHVHRAQHPRIALHQPHARVGAGFHPRSEHRHHPTRIWRSRAGPGTTTTPARSSTCSRATLSMSCPFWQWSRRAPSAPAMYAMAQPGCCGLPACGQTTQSVAVDGLVTPQEG
jgi:hypothetical protein